MTTSNVNQSENTAAEESRGNRRRANEERIDAVFEVLADARRRVVRLLRTHEDGVATVPELAEALAVREPGDREPSRIVVSLRHVHLPKLDATGVVEYTADQSQVRYADPPLVEHLLEQI